MTVVDRMKHTPVSKHLRVLIVEDNADIRETLRVVLQLHGHRVEVAGDGVEGVRCALDGHPQAALIDIGLPRMDGFEVARRLRAALDGSIHMAACSAFSQPEDQQRASAAGFDTYLVKPIDPETLVAWLDAVGDDEASREHSAMSVASE